MKLLRKTIRKLILEGLKFEEMGNLCLYQGKWARDDHYVLFHLELIDDLRHFAGIPNEIQHLAEETELIYGLISVKNEHWPTAPCNDAGVVNFSAAKPGWGPTMYDIAMGLHPDGLIADRDQVSYDAFDLWKFYKEKRPDIEKKPLDHFQYEWTDEGEDDCMPGSDGKYLPGRWAYGDVKSHDDFLKDPLSWSYNRGPVPNMDQLRQNWDLFESMLEEDGIEFVDETFWVKLSLAFFDKYYRG